MWPKRTTAPPPCGERGRSAGRANRPGCQAAEAAARRLARRDLRRAAAFLWMTPLVAALSMRFMAMRSASAALSAPASAAATAFLVRVRSSDRTVLLATRRFSFWRLRLIWLLMLATVAQAPLLRSESWTSVVGPPLAVTTGAEEPASRSARSLVLPVFDPAHEQMTWRAVGAKGRVGSVV